jgi:hypothetical protein
VHKYQTSKNVLIVRTATEQNACQPIGQDQLMVCAISQQAVTQALQKLSGKQRQNPYHAGMEAMPVLQKSLTATKIGDVTAASSCLWLSTIASWSKGPAPPPRHASPNQQVSQQA